MQPDPFPGPYAVVSTVSKTLCAAPYLIDFIERVILGADGRPKGCCILPIYGSLETIETLETVKWLKTNNTLLLGRREKRLRQSRRREKGRETVKSLNLNPAVEVTGSHGGAVAATRCGESCCHPKGDLRGS
jgi:hypothetical protein